MDDSNKILSQIKDSIPKNPTSLGNDENENVNENNRYSTQMDFKSQHPKKPLTKNFMSTTISASIRTVTQRTKILSERNEPSGYDHKTPNLQQKLSPNKMVFSNLSTFLGSKVLESYELESDENEEKNMFIVDSSTFCHHKTTNLDQKLSPKSEENVMHITESVSPYDPFTNYLSPRPKFLRYNPNRRCEFLVSEVKDSVRLNEVSCCGSKEVVSDEEELSSNTGDGFSVTSSGAETSLKHKNGEINRLKEEDEEEEEAEDVEVIEGSGGCLKWILNTVLVLVVLVISSSYISSMNSPPSPPALQCIRVPEDNIVKLALEKQLGGEIGLFHEKDKLEMDRIQMSADWFKPGMDGIEMGMDGIEPGMDQFEPSIDGIETTVDYIEPGMDRFEPSDGQTDEIGLEEKRAENYNGEEAMENTHKAGDIEAAVVEIAKKFDLQEDLDKLSEFDTESHNEAPLQSSNDLNHVDSSNFKPVDEQVENEAQQMIYKQFWLNQKNIMSLGTLFLTLIATLAVKFYVKSKKPSVKTETSNVELRFEAKNVDLNMDRPLVGCSREEEEKGRSSCSNQMPGIELLSEFVFDEFKIRESVEMKSRSKDMDSPSGIFTPNEKIAKKHEGKDTQETNATQTPVRQSSHACNREETPIRRSSRIRNQELKSP